VLVTGTDVLHSWFVPSFGVQQYAVIGRNNEAGSRSTAKVPITVSATRSGGINHSRMPIKVVAVRKPDFEKWLARPRRIRRRADGKTTRDRAGESRRRGCRARRQD
jgi:cytochrome c oxidase subunit 2